MNSFERPAVAIVKHLSPCGIACADTPAGALLLALASDPVSAFGGVIASNRSLGVNFGEALGDLFVECIAAPGFTPEALGHFKKQKNLRLLAIPEGDLEPPYELR